MNPQRLFTFGCSFTNYHWLTWADILAYEYNIPYQNLGNDGAGNTFIFNQVMSIDSLIGFAETDLVVVSWTNICREDRFKNGHWVCPGNIFTQTVWSENYVKEWADTVGYAHRDFAHLHAVNSLLALRGCKSKMIAMCNIAEQLDQFTNTKITDIDNLIAMYQKDLSTVAPSFYEILWNNDIDNKRKKNRELFGFAFGDCHPSPIEHLEYVQHVFGPLSGDTVNAVTQLENEWQNTIQKHKKEDWDAELYTELANKIRLPTTPIW